MSQTMPAQLETAQELSPLAIDSDTPVNPLMAEKQQRLLTEPLYSNPSLFGDRPFLAASNVAVFYAVQQSPVVPDMFLSLGVNVPQNWPSKKNRTYLIWEVGKPPDVAIEIASSRIGPHLERRLQDYANIRISYYVLYDPLQKFSRSPLRVFELRGNTYTEIQTNWLEAIGLGLTIWNEAFEDKAGPWLRWCDRLGALVPTVAERAEQERLRAEQEFQRAEQERRLAEQERLRAEREHQRAEQERLRAEQEHQRAEQERLRAEQEHQRAEQEHKRAEQAEAKAALLAEMLRLRGMDPDSDF